MQCLLEAGKEFLSEFRTNFFVMKGSGLKFFGCLRVKANQNHPNLFRICIKTCSAGSS